DDAEFDPTAPFVAVGGSALFAKAGADAVLRQGMADLVGKLKSRIAPVVLTASDVPDETVFRQLARDLDLPLVGLDLPVQQGVNLLSNAVAYVGGRWHPSIFAAMGGTPFVPLATHGHKLQGLSETFELPAPSADPFALTDKVEEIVDLVEEHVRAGSGLRERLSALTRELRPGVTQHVEILR